MERIKEFTPGPWSVGNPCKMGSEKHSYVWWDVPIHVGEGGNRGNCFATVSLGGNGAISSALEDAKANAHLISAAPDLHDALKAFFEFFNQEGRQFYIAKIDNRITNGDQDKIDGLFKNAAAALVKAVQE